MTNDNLLLLNAEPLKLNTIMTFPSLNSICNTLNNNKLNTLFDTILTNQIKTLDLYSDMVYSMGMKSK